MPGDAPQPAATAFAFGNAPQRWFAASWAVALLFHHRLLIPWPGDPAAAAALVSVAAAVATLVRPDRALPLGMLAAAQLANYALSSPVTSNHYTLAAFVNVAVLFALLTRRESRGAFGLYAPVGRGIAVLAYFWSFLHKLNDGFLDPVASCAVVLTDGIARSLGGSAFPLPAALPIYGTLLVEGLAALLLLSKRGWPLAVLLVLPLHYAIPFSGFEFYVDFSTEMLALLILFVGADRLDELASSLGIFGSGKPDALQRRRVIVGTGVAVALAVSTFASSGRETAFPLAVYFLYAAPMSAALGVSAAQALSARDPLPQPRFGRGLWLAIPLAFFVNAASPHLGLRTENAMAMYSNLRTEGGTANHLLLRGWARWTGAQRPVRILRSDLPSLAAFAGRRDRGLPWFEFWRRVGNADRGSVRYEVGGEIFDHVVGSDPPGTVVPGWLARVAVFRPIEFRSPSPCTH